MLRMCNSRMWYVYPEWPLEDTFSCGLIDSHQLLIDVPGCVRPSWQMDRVWFGVLVLRVINTRERERESALAFMFLGPWQL